MVFESVAPLQFDYLISAGYRALIAGIILAVGWVIGRVVGAITGKVVGKIGVDASFRRTMLGRALIKSGFTASEFSKTLAKWFIYIAAILYALESLELSFLSAGVEAFLAFLPSLVGAVLILAVGLTVSDWVGELIKKGFTTEQRQTLYVNLVGDVVKVVLYFVTLTMALSHLRMDVTILHIFAQALAWAVAISVGVAVGIVAGWLLKDKAKELLH
jgi:hypothetical protein